LYCSCRKMAKSAVHVALTTFLLINVLASAFKLPVGQAKNHIFQKTDSSKISDGMKNVLSLGTEISKICAASALAFALATGSASALPQKPPESNAQIILMEALPDASAPAKELAAILGKITTEGSGNIRSVDAKGQKGIKPWDVITKAHKAAEAYLANNEDKMIAAVQPKFKGEAGALVAALRADLADLGAAAARREALDRLDELGTMMVKAGFPGAPDEEVAVPKFAGRAVVEMRVSIAKTQKTEPVKTMKIILDGVNAPYSTGNFLDLVSKGFYDGLPVTFVDESTVLSGDPPGPAQGYEPRGPAGGPRTLPLELRAEGDREISYGETLEEQGRFTAKPVLPFSAYGALAMAHPSDNPNGGSSQIFFLKFDPVYTPAGLNTLDGNYAIFGYVTQGSAALDDMDVGDKIESVSIQKRIEI